MVVEKIKNLRGERVDCNLRFIVVPKQGLIVHGVAFNEVASKHRRSGRATAQNRVQPVGSFRAAS